MNYLDEFDIFWQCPKCGCANKTTTNSATLNLSKFGCCQCGGKYTLQRSTIQVLCQPLISNV